MKPNGASIRKHGKTGSFAVLLACFFAFIVSSAAAEEAVFFGKHEKTVVIDPGHGGSDTGTAGMTGLAEKSLTLEFARLLAEQLKNQFNVHLTRTDDYQVSIADRSAAANHFQGDVFISIHAGGAFDAQTSGMTVYSYGPEFRDLSIAPPSAPQPEETETTSGWDRLQLRHMGESRRLAASIRDRLTAKGVFEVRSAREAPLLVLESADTPAVLLEIATLSHPMDASSVEKSGNLKIIAETVANGIRDYAGTGSE